MMARREQSYANACLNLAEGTRQQGVKAQSKFFCGSETVLMKARQSKRLRKTGRLIRRSYKTGLSNFFSATHFTKGFSM